MSVSRICLNAFRTEEQAISIYEAQIYWRGERVPGLFRDILQEEREHARSVRRFAEGLRTSFMNRLAGYALGSFLSLLPSGVCFRIHIWAEEQAAEIYRKAAHELSRLDARANASLISELMEAAQQELGHARRFRQALERTV